MHSPVNVIAVNEPYGHVYAREVHSWIQAWVDIDTAAETDIWTPIGTRPCNTIHDFH